MSRPAPSLRDRRNGFGSGALVLLAALSLVASAPAQKLLPPDPSKTVGGVVRLDGFIDENGQELDREPQADARPWIASPMYTHCPHTCSAVTAGLRRAIEESGLAPFEYRVVSFSFDPNETADGLRSFRRRMQLPEGWVTLRARNPEALERTLKALDFHTISIGSEDFDHPNLIVVLSPDMRLASYLFGVTFSPSELRRSVRRARDGVSPVDAWRVNLFLFAAIGFFASTAAFAALLSRNRARRRTLATGSDLSK